MKPKTKWGLIALSTFVGGASLLLFSTLIQNVFFKEVNFCASTASDLMLKTTALFAAGGVVGFKSSLIVVRTNFWPHALISVAVVLQLLYVGSCPFSGSPLWFDVFQNGVLISGLWLGNYGAHKFPLAPI